LVDQGNVVHATDTIGLVVLTQMQPISVIFTLPQDQLQEVLQTMKSTSSPLKVVAQGRGNQTMLGEGQLELVDNLIDPTTGSVRLKATFPNTDYALWPGQYVNIRLLLKTLPQVVTAPSTAVQRGPNGMYVYIVKPDSTVAMQSVDVQQMADGTSVVDKGLDAGTRIVTAGQYRLQPGSPVRSTDAATNVASGK
jgi:multidrug efflux system membrane fusion protein